jgi:hypothetical protein
LLRGLETIAEHLSSVEHFGELGEMAEKYVDAMASALQEYDANYTVPYQVYQDLAWGGLQETDTFKKLPFADQQRILNVISTELTGADTNGITKTQNGKKTGC